MTLRLEPFTKSELSRIHGATVRILEGTGIRILEPEAAKLLEAAGASWDSSTSIVKFPEPVLKELLMRAPSRFKLFGRDPKHVLSFGEGNVYMSTMGTAVQVEDADGTIRPAALKDVENFYRLSDGLPFLDHSSWMVWPRDVPDSLVHIYEVLYGFRHNTKSIDGYNWGRAYSQDTIDMAAIVAGGMEELVKRPLLLGFTNPVSPLTLAKETTEGLIVFAKNGQPCIMPPECMAGGTAPSTLAGVLVQQNAEVLASIAVAEAARRGAPVFYGSVSTIMDMRIGTVALGAPEAGLLSLGAAQLARYYGIPARGTGGNTEALTSDFQAGAESAMTLLLAALAGFDFIYDAAGSLESSLTASYAKLLLDSDVCGAVRRTIAGIDVSDDTLATEVIEAVGLKGAYLSHPHTMSHFKSEHFQPTTFHRGGRTEHKEPDRALKDRAQARCDKILKEHQVVPLDASVESKLNDFLKKAMRRPAVAPKPIPA